MSQNLSDNKLTIDLEEIDGWINTHLSTILAELEREQKKLPRSDFWNEKPLSILIKIFIWTLLISISLIGIGSALEEYGWLLVLGFLGLMGCGLIFLLVILCFMLEMTADAKTRRTHGVRYKALIFPKVVKLFSSDIAYRPSGKVEEESIINSGLFTHSHLTSYMGEDLFFGTIEGVPFRFSELSFPYLRANSNKNAPPFSCIFFQAEFNKSLKHFTWASSNPSRFNFEKRILNQERFVDDLTHRAEKVKLEDPRFSASFEVWSTNQIEARYCLTTSFMERLMEMWDSFENVDIWVSFHHKHVSMAIAVANDRFRPKVSRHETDAQVIRRFLSDLSQFSSILKTLKLDQELWPKHSDTKSMQDKQNPFL